MTIKRIVGLSFLFLLGNSYLSAMNIEITKSQIKDSKEFFKKEYGTRIKCGSDCKHNKALQVDLKENEIGVKCLNSDIVLTTRKINDFEEKEYMILFKDGPPHYKFKTITIMPIGYYKGLKHFNVFQKLYQLKKSKRQKNKKYITILSLCRKSKTE